jgi:hypothetical protein
MSLQSRLYGRMHFAAAVPAGSDICSVLVNSIVNYANLLKRGDPVGSLADKDDTSIVRVHFLRGTTSRQTLGVTSYHATYTVKLGRCKALDL